MTDTTHLAPKVTDRGFKHLPPVDGMWSGSGRVYESSMAFSTCLWLSLENLVDLNHPGPDSPTHDITVQFHVDQARQFAEQILWLCDNHYHHEYYGGPVDERDEDSA